MRGTWLGTLQMISSCFSDLDVRLIRTSFYRDNDRGLGLSSVVFGLFGVHLTASYFFE